MIHVRRTGDSGPVLLREGGAGSMGIESLLRWLLESEMRAERCMRFEIARHVHCLLTPSSEGIAVKTIFVLDDDPEQAELMAQALTGRGRRVRAFSDPIRALAALSLDGADLLIADLSMPSIHRNDVVASAQLRRPELKIFMVSGYPRGAEIAAESGVPFF